MPQTTKMNFSTRYGISVIDSQTGQPTTPTVWVDNILLRRGSLALGNEIAYQTISVGTSNTPTDTEQESLINSVSDYALSNAEFSQEIFQEGNRVISRIQREITFKTFRFPSSERILTINEIGLTHVTRAVLPTPIEIKSNNWLKVIVQIDYVYTAQSNQTIPKKVNSTTPSEVLRYNVTPFIFNPNPTNINGRGYGVTNALYGYVWDGTTAGLANRTFGQTLGIAVNAILDYNACCYRFILTGSFPTPQTIPGFIIRDTINGGAYQITFPDGLTIEEDDSIQMEFVYSWAITSTLTASI